MSIDWSVLDSYYSRISHIYDATRPLPQSVSAQIADRIIQIVAATPATKFLEPGIGTGRTGLPLIQRGYAYTGIDISTAMMNELTGKFSQMPENLTLIQGDAANLPFDANSFDVAITTHMLQCLTDPLKGLSEIRRVLKPDGVYLACENLLSTPQKEVWAAFTKIISQYPSKSKSPIEEKFVPFGETLQQELANQGAIVEKITAVQWQQNQSVGELFNAYKSRAFGLCWVVTEADFNQAIQEFETWCLERYQSFEAVLVNDFSFEIIVAKNWV